MTEEGNFVTALARAGKSCREIKPLVDAAYGDEGLSVSQINRIIKALKKRKTTADLRHSNPKKTRRADDAVASIAAAVEENRQITICELAAMPRLTFGTVQAILTDNLGLVKSLPAGSSSCCPVIRKQREWIAAMPSWTSFGGSRWRS
jgi:hypothetical protein